MTRINSTSYTSRARLQAAAAANSELRAATIDTGRLKNLKVKLDVNVSQLKDRGTRFQEANFGHVVGGGAAGNHIDGLRGLAGVHSRNPIDQQGLGLVMGRNGMVSEEPAAEERSWTDRVADFASGVFGAIVSKLEFPGFPAWGLLTAPGSTGTPDGPQNIGEGVKAFGRMANGEYYHPGMADVDDGTKEPTPEDNGSSPRYITRDDLRGILAKQYGAAEPTGEEAGSGGPVNTGATGTGKTGSQVELINDFAHNVSFNSLDIKGIQARILSRIQIIR